MPHYVKITAVHPESSSVDVEMQDGRVLSGVTVLSQSASGNSGCVNLPDPTNNQVFAVMDFFDREVPFIYGFIFPQVAQCLFSDNRAINRHHSGAYTSVKPDASMEVYHPSGAFIRIAESQEHEHLTGADYDEKWTEDKNTDQEIFITIKNGAGKIVIANDGSVTITGQYTFSDDVIAGGISLINHVHGNGNGGADTTAPIA